jgi:YD repeat-containing protein
LPDEIREALKEMPYFVADSFCNWLVHERKIWRVAPGEGGEWWDECRENGCIVIGWSKAAEKAPNNDFRQLSEDDLEKLFEEVYEGGKGAGGHRQVRMFVHEIQPGDIIVAKSGTNKILGIGIVTSNCIPPGHRDHPLGNKHEFRHARKVDWRITESVRVNFNLGGQTVVRERRWDDIVKAYQVEGIEVYERLWGSGNSSSPSLVRYFEAKGFQFTEEQVVAFYAALKTKGFVILSGLSGTGKTKLAQLFAELFTFEREVEPEIGEDEIVLTVQPYMLKYRRFIIPVGYWHLLPSLNVGEELSVEVTVEGTKETCRLKRWEHPAHEQGYMQLLLKGTVAAWFANNLKEGDRFSLQLDYDENGNLRGITISRVQKVKIKEPACCFLSVRPDWRDSKALLGYYNPLTERYESTPLLEFLLRAAWDYKQNESNAQPYFVILDEMNLAHVEYYFADFLSVLESGRDEEGWTKEALRLHSFGKSILDQDGYPVPPELRLPPNLYIIGTVNIDETTYMFSPKVLDRAFTLEFREVNFGDYPPKGTDKSWTPEQTEELRQNILEDLRNGGKFCAVVADKDVVKEALQDLGDKKTDLGELNDTLQPYDLHFGYRVMDEIALFVQNAKNAPDVVGRLNEDKALDYAVLMKVLPKFHGPRQKLEKPLREVLKWAAKGNAPEWVKDTSKPITLEQITEALQKWERLDATQQQTQQEVRQGADRQAEQPANAQQEQGNQTETTPTQAAQGETKGQSEASTEQSFKKHFRYPNTAKKVLQMLRQLYETGFASFAQ